MGHQAKIQHFSAMKEIVHIQHYEFPCGEMVLAAAGEALCLCDWSGGHCAERNMLRLARLLDAEFREETAPVLERAKTQLDGYFAGSRQIFDIPLRPVGTVFQKSVWAALLEIPYGETRSYRQIAQRIGNGRGVRAVAQAIGANGIGIIIPCHRVIGSDRSLTGFAGGLSVKRALLQLEGITI